MGSRNITGSLQSKTWQLGQDESGNQGYLYSCSLCDEALVLSKQFINPRKIQLVYFDTCPGCGFELEKTIRVQRSTLPPEKRFFYESGLKDTDQLIEPDEFFETRTNRGSRLPRGIKPDLTTEIDSLDKTLALRFGELVSLQGEESNALSLLLCVRAINPLPPGLDSDVVFVDGGNVFDAYTVSLHAFRLGLDPEEANLRIHLSRAFTHHQLSNLINEKLSSAIDQYDARLAIVPDITALYCDPDVKEKREAFDLFSSDIHSLATLAEQRNVLIIVTNLKSRNKAMDNALDRTAHVSATLHDKGAHTQLTVTKHPFIQEGNREVVTLDNQTLTTYL
jgi:Rad51